MLKIKIVFFLLFTSINILCVAQESKPKDSLSKFDKFNKKAEALFKKIPVPIVSYSTEAGNTFGLAKFNAFPLVKKDTVSQPSKLSEVVSFSTKGRVNISISNDLVFKENKYIIVSYFNYKKTPEYLLGIGNKVSLDNLESVTTNRVKFYSNALMRVRKNMYVGVVLDLAEYFDIKTDSNSFLIRDNISGLKGGTDFGLGVSAAYDSRDNRYNPHKGQFLLVDFLYYPAFIGSDYQFSKFDIDARKYFKPWLNHVVAIQATTSAYGGDVPFYDLALMGGEDKMRGYYKGAIRDKVLVDAQVEYRLPVWKIFGVVGWFGTGRVAPKYSKLSLDGLWFSYGGGLRIKVDSKSDINLRIDFGFGPHGVSGFYLNFAEAF